MIELKEKIDCAGCSACIVVCPVKCISMNKDMEGFLYPKVDKSRCINCNLCEKVCPIINGVEEVVVDQKAYLLQNKDDRVLRESTSGGAFTAIAEYIIDKNGVVFGAAFDKGFVVKHIMVDNKLDLAKFRNSKYVQSEIGLTYIQVKHFLHCGRMVLFSGTPCQVEGLNSYLNKKYDNLILVDVVCRSVPSPLIWEKYKELKSKQGKTIQDAKFRSKELYGYQYSQIEMEFKDKSIIHAGVEADPYLRAFFNDLSIRPSCYNCKFKKRYRVSDITMWDCFDSYRFEKKININKGVTRILTHTNKGKEIIEQCQNNCRIIEINADDAVYRVNELIQSVKLNIKRQAFFEDANLMEVQAFFQKWFPKTLKVKISYLIRNIGMKLGVFPYIKRCVKKALGR